MKKNINLIFLVILCLQFFSSCIMQRIENVVDEIFVSDDQRADTRMEQIVSAIKDKDKEALKSLFSKKAIYESSDFDDGIDSFFNFIQGDVESWERDVLSTSKSMGGGKTSLMLRFGIDIKTDKENYIIFIIDYNVDTKNPDNEGIYMLEISKSGYDENLGSWQERMRAGFYILEESSHT